MRVTGSSFSSLAALLGLASATYAMPSSPTVTEQPKLLARATTTESAVTHTVSVGSKISPHAFVPSNITANPGDTILFEFYPTNHSVAKADYLAPCVPASSDVFWSGSFADFTEDSNGNIVGDPPTWSLLVNDTEPTFFYCTALGSCMENGMVGVINPNSTRTYQSQYDQAVGYPVMIVPGQSTPAEGSKNEGEGSDSGSSDSSSGGSHGLSKGAIAGIVIAAVAFVAIVGALLFLLGRNRVYQKWMTSQENHTERTQDWAMSTTGSVGPWTHKSDGGATSTVLSSPPLESPQWVTTDPQQQTYSEAPDTSTSATFPHNQPQNRDSAASGGFDGSVSRNKAPTELPAYDPPQQYGDRY